jgi:hypothetical protein
VSIAPHARFDWKSLSHEIAGYTRQGTEIDRKRESVEIASLFSTAKAITNSVPTPLSGSGLFRWFGKRKS